MFRPIALAQAIGWSGVWRAGFILILLLVETTVAETGVATSYSRNVINIEGQQVFFVSTTGNPINKKGRVAGSTRVDGFERAAVLDTSTGRLMVLPTLGGQNSEARDINSGGYVVGSSETESGERHPFLWLPDDEQMIDLGTLGGKSGFATALNDWGFIVGFAMTLSGEMHAFRRDPRTHQLIDLGTLGGTRSQANSINEAGYIVGLSSDASDRDRAFLWDPANMTMRDLGTLAGKSFARANDINQALVIVGDSFTSEGSSSKPFIWAPHLTRPALLPGDFTCGTAAAISPDGTVVGQINCGDVDSRAVVWLGYGGEIAELPRSSRTARALAISRSNLIIGLDGSISVHWNR